MAHCSYRGEPGRSSGTQQTAVSCPLETTAGSTLQLCCLLWDRPLQAPQKTSQKSAGSRGAGRKGETGCLDRFYPQLVARIPAFLPQLPFQSEEWTPLPVPLPFLTPSASLSLRGNGFPAAAWCASGPVAQLDSCCLTE